MLLHEYFCILVEFKAHHLETGHAHFNDLENVTFL